MVPISVVMPTYNTEISMLKEAVDSILNQTFQNFEFIIIDDGSTNESVAYLDTLTDPRIRLIRNKSNLGITKSLNIGLRAAKGKYIARMDSDDVSFPTRFEKQYSFMESHPDVILCGSQVTNLNEAQRVEYNTNKTIEDMENYRVRMLFCFPGPSHPTVFFNREILCEYGIEYDENLIYAQDYGLYATIAQNWKICVLPNILLYRRMHFAQITQAHREKQIQCAKITQKRLLMQLLGNVTEKELDFHFIHSTGYYRNAVISSQADEWYKRIIKSNNKHCIYNSKKLKHHIERIKINLIEQTFTKNMSKLKKLFLLLRYLSFFTALKLIIRILNNKLNYLRDQKKQSEKDMNPLTKDTTIE